MFTQIVTLLAFSTVVHGLAFDGPVPTPVKDSLIANFNGFSPKPTAAARSLDPNHIFRRQSDDDKLCGYLEGDADSPFTCTEGGCSYNIGLGLFGCCTGTSGDGCATATGCVASVDVDSCLSDPSCSTDSVIFCTESSFPFCQQLYSTVEGNMVFSQVCAKSAFASDFEVLPSPTTTVAGDFPSSDTSARSRTSSTSDDDNNETLTSAITTARTSAPNDAATSSAATSSTAAAAVHTVQAVIGGLAGVLAVLM